MIVTGNQGSSARLLQSASPATANGTARPPFEWSSGQKPQTASFSHAVEAELVDAQSSTETDGVSFGRQPEDIWFYKEKKNEAVEEFMSLSEMTLAERIRYFFLKDRELDETKLDEMTPQDREEIEDQIRQEILERLGVDDQDGKPSASAAVSTAADSAQAPGGAEAGRAGQGDLDLLVAALYPQPAEDGQSAAGAN